jgi:hypothetical protein
MTFHLAMPSEANDILSENHHRLPEQIMLARWRMERSRWQNQSEMGFEKYVELFKNSEDK